MNKKPIVLGVFLILLITIISPTTSISKTTSNTISLNDNGWEYDEDTGTWSIEFPAEPIKESFTTKYYNQYSSKVAVIFSHEYYFPQYTDGDKSYFSKEYIEISNDYEETWEIFDTYETSSNGDVRDLYIVLGQSYRIRFTVEGIGDNFISESGGYWRIWDIDLIGDTTGESPESHGIVGWFEPIRGWWYSPLSLIIVSDDIIGVREIHYILNRQESVVLGDSTRVDMYENGFNFLSFWAVDILGNEETPFILPIIKIDYITPNVEIISPKPGLYIFDRKIPIPINKTIVIGDFTFEAIAFDNVSGVYKVSFYLNDIWLSDLTEEPYKIHCNIRHSGNARLRVVAEDYPMNEAEDTLDFVYYNFL
jgi:hypothetical protein